MWICGMATDNEQITAFRQAMAADGWTPIHDIWGDVYNWQHRNGYKVDNRSAFEFWRMTKWTPMPF